MTCLPCHSEDTATRKALAPLGAPQVRPGGPDFGLGPFRGVEQALEVGVLLPSATQCSPGVAGVYPDQGGCQGRAQREGLVLEDSDQRPRGN